MLFFNSCTSKGSGILLAMSLATLLMKVSRLMPVLAVPTRGCRSTYWQQSHCYMNVKCVIQKAKSKALTNMPTCFSVNGHGQTGVVLKLPT